MPAIKRKRISKLGGSKVIPLPLDWARAFDLESGDFVEAFYDSIVVLIPPNLEIDIHHIIYELQLLKRFKGNYAQLAQNFLNTKQEENCLEPN